MTGTIINVILVLLGSTIGLIIHRRFPERIRIIVFQAIGLFTVVLGIYLSLKSQAFLVIIFSLISGALIGEGFYLQERIEKGGDNLKNWLKVKNENFTEGLITAFMLFCIGSFTILGAIEEGLTGDFTLLLTKSVMDGFSSIALASAFGFGVIFSVIPLFIYQGSLTIFASYIAPYLDPVLQNEISAVGGILIIGLGISILEIKKIRILNLTPALITLVPIHYLEAYIRSFF
ncbi:DUF554 domain-containing protein [Hyphobacterium sp. CCMP332]|nr:DUF554 domain-containing protein [Hyphobacterium sp. CCMP332]